VTLGPAGQDADVSPGITLLEAWPGRAGLDPVCGGKGRCGGCRVRILGGDVSGADEDEIEVLARLGSRPEHRLACRVRVLGDVRALADPPGGAGRTPDHREPLPVSTLAAPAAAAAGRLGLAVDLGTTKLAGYLADLDTGTLLETDAIPNPQRRFGADVISRLGYALTSPRHYRQVREAAALGVTELADRLCRKVGRSRSAIREMTVAGNPAMHHLLLGLDVITLARAPFQPATVEPITVPASEIGLDVGPAHDSAAGPASIPTLVYFLPCVAGFVGGDHVAALLATGAGTLRGGALIVDIGTNAEITLARGGALTTCSCASGPAFEGAQISRGMRAVAGAVDKVWLEGGRLRFRVIGGGAPAGICGAGLLDLVAALLATGTIDRGGRLRAGAEGVGLFLTQADIRELQLAKAAVRVGIEALLRETGTVVEEIERVYLAGSFGTNLDPEKAVAIGLFPPLSPDRFVAVGNAAGQGALSALTSPEKRAEAVCLARKVRHLDLTSRPGYQEHFLGALGF